MTSTEIKVDYEYRIMCRNDPQGKWRQFSTGRGGFRPLTSLAAARGIVTREENIERRRMPGRAPREFRIEERPVEQGWKPVAG